MGEVEVLQAAAKAGLGHTDTAARLMHSRNGLEAYEVVEVDVAWAAGVAAEARADPALVEAFANQARAQREARAGRAE